MHTLNSLPGTGRPPVRRLLTAYARSRSLDYYTRVIELLSFIREWKIVSSFIREWKIFSSFIREWKIVSSFIWEWKIVSSFIREWKIVSSFIQEWRIVSSFIQEWKMKYDLAIRWGKRQQVFCITVRHAISHFYYVIAPADSCIRTTHFLGIIQFTPSCRVRFPCT